MRAADDFFVDQNMYECAIHGAARHELLNVFMEVGSKERFVFRGIADSVTNSKLSWWRVPRSSLSLFSRDS